MNFNCGIQFLQELKIQDLCKNAFYKLPEVPEEFSPEKQKQQKRVFQTFFIQFKIPYFK